MDNEYILIDYSNKTDDGEPKIVQIFGEEKIWREVEKAKNDDRKIVIFKLGNCLLDWS